MTITFTSLILSEMLNVFTEIHNIRIVTFLAQALTLGVYISTIIFLKDYINTASIDLDFGIKVATLTLISWLPIHLA